ncbi:MAG: ABC transporter substrate-binding protein [Planctomycetota bacterium]
MIALFLRLALVLVVCLMGASVVQRLLARNSPPSDKVSVHVTATKPFTLADVLAANIPTPIRSRVSFPGYSYAQAQPGSQDAPEIVITHFAEAPELAARTTKPRDDPDWLPPVAERMPRNPAVVRGPDGIGVYGGDWKHCISGARGDLGTKIGYESLVRFDPSGRLQPGLAHRWEVSPDNRVFTFYLRKGHRWSNGQPFTAQDITWTCNVDIGSAHWSPPDWTRPTDGATRLYVGDVRDWPALAKAIVDEPTSPSPAAQLRAQLTPEALALLRDLAAGKALPATGEDALTNEFNRILSVDVFADGSAWRSLDLTQEIRDLTAKGHSRLSKAEIAQLHLMLERKALFERVSAKSAELDPADRSRLQMLLFRAAFARWVTPAEKRRVKVEAIPDEDGDNSHIVRFTFDNPNSIFLEKTATFMCYTGLFKPSNTNKVWHVDGMIELADCDIIDWPGLARLLMSAQDGTTALGRLAGLLSESTRAALTAISASEQPTPADRARLIADLNRIAEGSDLYQPGVWPEAAFDQEVSEIQARNVLGFGFPDWRRYDELCDRQDLMRRAASNGVATLSAVERIRLHGALIRASVPAQIIALNREAGLDYLAQHGPRKYGNWMDRYRESSNYHPVFNPHVPTLTAWRSISEKKELTNIAIRNPYYYKVDEHGNQLPYINRIITQTGVDHAVQLLKLRSGNIDFQIRDLTFADFTVLKQNETIGKYEIRLWANDYCGEVNFWPLQTHRDPEYRRLFTDRRFRQALSLGLNRQEIIDVVYKGMGKPMQHSIPEGSPYYNAKLAKAYIAYDPARANALLDAIGIAKRNSDGMRLFWDGRPITIDLNTAGSVPNEVVQMACNAWQALGLNVQLKFRQGMMMNRMIEMGTADIVAVWEGGSSFGPLLAGSFAPTHPAESPQWSAWVKHLSGFKGGAEEPPPWLIDINRIWESVLTAKNKTDQLAAWAALTDQAAEDLSVIGIMTSPGRLVYVRNGFKNVPKLALAGWIAHEPGNSCPEAFFFDPKVGN